MKRPQTLSEIREAFLTFFESHKHSRVPSSRVVPDNDPTLMFANAGMNQFKEVFLGLDKRDYSRATSVQKCVRAGGKHNDLENVGFTERHHTFFEMLGNFSFGDYFKVEAIEFAWKFITEVLQLPKEKLAVSVYKDDLEAAEIWKTKIGIPEDRIFYFGDEDNFWQMGDTGPCGPCSEIFWDQGEEVDGERWLEFWNCVFMQYDRQADGELKALAAPCVDTGMGLERIAAIMQGVRSNYDTDLFQALLTAAQNHIESENGGRKIDLSNKQELSALRVIVDHLRSTSFLIADGVIPSNEGRGYVLRRILRRALRFGKFLGVSKPFMSKLFPVLQGQMSQAYPELKIRQAVILETLKQEEEKFFETLETGLKLLEEAFKKAKGTTLDGKTCFQLYDTYGFPLDLTALIAKEKGFLIDQKEFDECMRQQKERSKASWKGAGGSDVPAEVRAWSGQKVYPDWVAYTQSESDSVLQEVFTKDSLTYISVTPCPFYAESGGQSGEQGVLISESKEEFKIDDCKKLYDGGYVLISSDSKAKNLKSGQKVKAVVDENFRALSRSNHTATHLLHSALRRFLGSHVQQAGSFLNNERLRFDFSHQKALSPEEKVDIENWVNHCIQQSVDLNIQEKTYDQAIEDGAMALFGEKYGDKVRVVDILGLSTELCGGLHVANTSDIQYFKLIEETGIASGTRRIEAITNANALRYLESQEGLLKSVASSLAVAPKDLPAKLEKMQVRQKELEKQIKDLQTKIALGSSSESSAEVWESSSFKLKFHNEPELDVKMIRQKADHLRQKDSAFVHFIFSKGNSLITADNKKVEGFHAGKLMKEIIAQFSGRGGGNDKSAQGRLEIKDNQIKDLKTFIEKK